MSFSERDRRLLEQLEASLHQDNPELDGQMKPADRPTWTAKRVRVAGAVVAVGLVVMVCGVGFAIVWVGVLGFLAMLAGTTWVAPSQDHGSVARRTLKHDHRGGGQ